MTDPPENSVQPPTVDLEVESITPRPTRLNAPALQPPPLTRGRRFRPIASPEAISPESGVHPIGELSGVTELTTPEKVEDEEASPLRRPTRRRLLSPASSCIKPTATKRPAETALEVETTSPKQRRFSSRHARFSRLFYIEAHGVLRQNRQTKHRGVHTPSVATCLSLRHDSPTSSCDAPDHWDRDVLVRISYRLSLGDRQPQFALIVYDHQMRNPRTRRNLMDEFQASEECVEKPPMAKVQRSVAKPSTVKKGTPTPGKLSSLRRLRF